MLPAFPLAPASIPADLITPDAMTSESLTPEPLISSSQVPAASSAAAITPERLAAFDDDAIAELAQRLEEDDYPSAFAGLDDWHLLRALAIHRPDLCGPYVHLVDQEPFDEE